ncbi:biotin carboxylase N-terminal domain-containing protein [Streptomyces peucetius]|uniref:ATP-grasp domain-containing protein n=1 Tax=Streptomyces peucetius TaxID=1950 RepID=A0ABY6IA18_STRPE|nr:biotin carboxylase N-terminal domain-containing protein [Streptomyces peucetius]UYQ62812.1 ATP-grasp domain-containing protein [Streptomyces peucetius]
MISTVLVANRGEIACRVFRTCRELGVATVAVHSDADAGALHVRQADAAVRLPGAAPAETYLRGELIVKAALAAGADAVHPGYGFLSENAGFARAVADAGLVWIGPPPEAIEAMASKTRAKKLMGLSPLDPASLTEADLPVLVKAAAGGGGRGMRVVRSLADLPGELAAASSEAASAFGDGEVFVEPYVENGRHVEVQIVADAHGTVWALGSRDCSLQRRHQKVIEESPAPGLPPELVAELHELATGAARAVDYRGAGTVEFLVDEDGRAHFLEMNTRLQVEHPVTEAVFGVDLVALQMAVAEGAPLPAAPPPATGHAIEARLYAEDPAAGWAPQTGTLHELSFPTHPPLHARGSAPHTPAVPPVLRAGTPPGAGHSVPVPGTAGTAHPADGAPGAAGAVGARWSTSGGPAQSGPGASTSPSAEGVAPARGATGAVGPAHGAPGAPGAGEPRPAAAPEAAGGAHPGGRGRSPWVRVDAGYGGGDVIGVHYDAMVAKVVAWAPTRAEAVRRLAHSLRRARIHGPRTNRDLLVASLEHPDFTGGRLDTGFYERNLDELTRPAPGEAHAAVAAAIADAAGRQGRFGGAWRNLASQAQLKTYGDHEIRYRPTRDGGFELVDRPGVRVVSARPDRVALETDGVVRHYDVAVHGDTAYVDSPVGAHALAVRPRFTDPQDRAVPGSLLAPMPGTVVRVGDGVTEGARVAQGQPLVWLEAMKMEHRVLSPASGTLTALHAVPGRQVEVGALLAVVTEEAQEDTAS